MENKQKLKVEWKITKNRDWRMTIEGTYPDGATKEEVERLITGHFGGYFLHFGNGAFTYVRYTD